MLDDTLKYSTSVNCELGSNYLGVYPILWSTVGTGWFAPKYNYQSWSNSACPKSGPICAFLAPIRDFHFFYADRTALVCFISRMCDHCKIIYPELATVIGLPLVFPVTNLWHFKNLKWRPSTMTLVSFYRQ